MAYNNNTNSQQNNGLTDYGQQFQQEQTQQRSGVDIRALVNIMLENWYWFVASIIVAIGLALIYLASSTQIFTRESQVLLKDDNSSASSVDIIGDLSGRPKINIENECRVFRSTTLMREVVQRLALQDSYWVQKGLKKIDLYKDSPVVVMPRDANNKHPFSMRIRVSNDGTVKIWDVESNDNSYSGTIETKLGETVKLPNGMVVTLLRPQGNQKTYAEYYNQDITFKHEDIDKVARRYVDYMSITVDSDHVTVLNLKIRAYNEKKADDALNLIVQVYNEKWLEDKNQVAVSTSRFIDERLGIIERELGNVDSDISEFKSDNLVPDLNEASALFMQQGSEADRTIFELSNQLSMARLMRQELHKGGIDEILPATSGISNNAIQAMMNEFNQLVLERNRLLSSSSEKNPVVQDLTNELRPMRNNILRSLDTYIATLTAQMGNAEARANNNTSKIAQSPKQAKYLLSVERQQKVKESLYLFLLQKREENELGQAFTAYNTRVIEKPHSSKEAPDPDYTKTLTLAIAIGFLLPMVILYLRTFFDNKVRNKNDLKGISAPYLGEIPNKNGESGRLMKLQRQLNKSPETITQEMVVSSGSRDAINEAFRVVRTNLEFMIEADREGEEGCEIIAVTSSNPGSGKTFISLNLSGIMAIRHKKVLMIDLDLRRGSLSRYLGSPRPGITDYLIGKSDLNDIIRHKVDGVDHLDAIPIGSVPPNPAELLAGDRIKELIAKLKEQYDYIFLDCPPVEIVTDALIINKLADRTLFVVRAGLLHKEIVDEIEQYYRTDRYKKISILLNGTDKYGGYGYSKYGYKYSTKGHYGYGE